MNRLVKWVSLLLAMVLMLSLIGCDKKNSSSKKQETEEEKVDVTPYIGTWRGSDHDGENVVHYVVFDENGYWNIYMNYATLTPAIRQLSEQLVSLKIFCQVQKSEHTGCYYEYVEGTEFAEQYVFDEDGLLTAGDISFTKVSDHSGEPDESVETEARELFDRAREAALSE